MCDTAGMETLRIGPGVPIPPRPPRWRTLLGELREVLADAAINLAVVMLGAGAVWVVLYLAE